MFLFDVFDAGLGAIVLVIGAMVVEGITGEMRSPSCCITLYIFLARLCSIRQESGNDLSLIIEDEKLGVTAIRHIA